MLTLARLRSLFVPVCIALALMVVAGWYYSFWLPSRHRYLDDRNFRVLRTLGEQIRLSIDGFDKMLDHAADSRITSESLKDYLRNVAPQLESPEEKESESVVRDDYGDPPKIAVAADDGTHFLYLAFQRAVNGTNIKYAVRANLEKLVGKLLPPPNRNPFDVVLLAQDNGTVIFQKSSPGIEVAHIDTFKDEPAAAKTGKPEAAGTEKLEPEVKKLSLSSRYAEVTLAGARYRLYSQPLQLSFPPIDPGKKGAKANTPPGLAEKWILCGLVRADNFRSESQSMSYSYILGFLASILLTVAAYPFLRLYLSNPTERLRPRDVVSTAVLMWFASVALTLVLLDLYYGRNELDQSGTDHTEQQMGKLAEAIDSNFRVEKAKAFDQLHDFYKTPALLTSLHEARASISTLPQLTHGGTGCTPSSACRVNILLTDRLQQYPYLQYTSWSNSDGYQVVKWTTKKTITPFIKLNKESYYLGVQRAFADVKRAQTDPEYAISAPTQGIGSQYSSNTGKNITIFWELVNEDGDLVAGKIDSKNAKKKVFCASLVTYPLSVVDPVLPGGFEFAVIRRDGTVVFHSDSTRNLRENFFDETDQDQDLRSRVLMRSDGLHVTSYMGRRHRLYIRSMSSSQDQMWSVIIFRDSRLEETMNLEVLSLASVMLLLYAAVMALVLLLAHWMRVGRGNGIWLWPDSRKAGTYCWLVITNSLGAFLLFVLPQFLNPFALFSCAVLIPLGVMVVNLLFLRRRESADEPNETRSSPWQLAYVLACATLLLVMAVLPCLSFFKVACDFEHKIFIERSQLGLAAAVDDRAELIRKRYQNVDLGRYASGLLAGPETQSTKGPRVEHGTQDTTVAPVFSYHETLDTTICPAEGCDPATKAPATRHSGPSERWQRRAELLLSRGSPSYNELAADNRYLAEAGSSENRSWSSTLVRGAEQLELRTSESGRKTRTVVSRWTPLRIPWNEWRWWVGTVAFMAALFWLVRLSLRRIFLLDLLDAPKGPQNPADPLDPDNLNAKPPINLLVIDSVSSPMIADLGKSPEVQAWDIRKVLEVSQQSPAADGSVLWLSTGDQVDQILHDGRPLVLHDFEGILVNPGASQQSRSALAKVLSKLGKSIVVTTLLDPVSKSSAQESKQWRTLLRPFVRIDLNSRPAVQQFERRTPVDPYHRWLFSGCAEPEKLLLVQLAQEKLINPNSRPVVDELIRNGLIVWRWGLLTVKSDRFADFLQRAVSPHTIKHWEKEVAGVPLTSLRMSLLVIGICVVGFLIYTQGAVFNTWVTYATGLAASVPAFLRLFDIFRGKGAQA